MSILQLFLDFCLHFVFDYSFDSNKLHFFFCYWAFNKSKACIPPPPAPSLLNFFPLVMTLRLRLSSANPKSSSPCRLVHRWVGCVNLLLFVLSCCTIQVSVKPWLQYALSVCCFPWVGVLRPVSFQCWSFNLKHTYFIYIVTYLCTKFILKYIQFNSILGS